MKPFAVIASVVLMSACGTNPPMQTAMEPVRWNEQQLWARDLDNWQAIAKLGIKTPKKSASARLNWRQSGPNYRIMLSGPLGFGTVLVTGNAERAQLQRGESIQRDTPDALMLLATGISLPSDALHWWMRGIPQPNGPLVTQIKLDGDGQILHFAQSGWALSFSNYQKTSAGYLPGKIIGKANQMSFKVIISQWDLVGEL